MTVFLILFALFALLLVGVPVAFALGGLGLSMLILGGFSPLMAPQAILSTLDGFILLAVPLFLLMSNVLLKGGVGRDLYAAVQAWVGHWPGGLAVATVISCGLFAAISGSSVATAATIGTVAIPEMINRGYERRFVYGLLAAGGTLGILIPPSIPMIIYGFVTEESVIALFLAGVGPGLALLVLFAGYSMIYASMKGMGRSEKATGAERRRATLRALPSIALATVVVAGIYSGAFTPTEAAAIGFAFAVVITALVLRTLTWKAFWEAAVDSMATTVAILLIIAGAKVFGKAITLYRIPQEISAFISDAVSSPVMFVLLVAGILVVMGLVLEALSMVLIMTPVLLPAAMGLGFDPIWFGVFMVVMVEAALITPPVGLNLYVIQAVARATLGDVARGAIPFLLLMFFCVVLLYLVPDLALYIPFKL
ncbi:TRAP transporter large permease subunit [Phaeobacter gallaeciensis]|jgi:C4-dicarboxylate transporter DctM subunit|uniref:TRAP transporter large permease n=1 Tax=Rhodobacterales TaxID=204455 RepID=UPI00237F1419|nr:TRAP transporter large permease subunit [Phaeobacter gallaeciensis]MDE4099301.1 TRAP transporter large permease subunit [Phaeobacter gallaeciensis]MDE4108070.1 TRAP transporter large permease subunit [Phaeobacter gallaeciensis]MDE4112565.1 TRAP transporter large permease subunit [Phaeobacter gallaeciensis]MDE4117036.1 TRAP transporter large permease subunit [Phaeobacter gallaeciensis]MDE4121508.1 TRAP transporter large permease subunit [Phaeobacter gallaeciensis]